MPYKFTLLDARNSLALKQVANVCSSGDQFREYVNEAQRRLLRRGQWFGTTVLSRFCVYNGCLTWPRYVGTVLGLRFCCFGEIDIRNNWFEIIGADGCSSFESVITSRDSGFAPTYNDITGTTGKYIRFFATKREDWGKKITIYGKDANGQPLQEKVNGVWQRGVTVTLGNTIPDGLASTSTLVTEWTSTVKQVTQGNVLAYEYDATSNTMRDLALYEPSETNPRYRRSFINNFCNIPGGTESNGVKYKTVEALIKLEFVEALTDNDFLMIDNFDALKLAIQAIRYEEQNDEATAETKWTKAVREMNLEDRDKTPGDQVTVRVSSVGRGMCSPI